jgi:hypothetical protein
MPAVRTGQWPDRERLSVRSRASAGHDAAGLCKHVRSVRGRHLGAAAPRIPASIFRRLTPGSRPLHVRVVVEGQADTVLPNQAAIVTFRHVVDAACPDISSYRAVATVSRQGTIRMR